MTPLPPVVVLVEGRAYRLERVRLDDLEGWKRERGLEPVGKLTLGDGDVWPPVVEYRKGEA